MCLYDCKWGETLADVEYLGYAKLKFLNALKYLKDYELYDKRDMFIPEIVRALDNIAMCSIKRLCIIMLVAERLGIYELVAAVAQHLFGGGMR
jgi:hypothetical protein